MQDSHQVHFQGLLSHCVDDATNQKYIYSDLSYFINDLNFGSNYHEGCMTDIDGSNIDFSDKEHLWKYFEKKMQNIVKTNEDHIRSLDTEELSEYIYSVYLTGIAKAEGKIKKKDLVDYTKWLKEEYKGEK